MALGDAILVCLTERPMTGYELAKTFDTSIGFFWRADHQQIYRELARLRDRGHVRGREVVQSGKPNKLVYTLTSEGRAALRHWASRPSSPSSIKDDLLVRLYAGLRMGLRYERAVAEWCEEALDTLSAGANSASVTPINGSQRENNGS